MSKTVYIGNKQALCLILQKLDRLGKQGERIMALDTQTQAEIDQVITTLGTIGTEVDGLVTSGTTALDAEKAVAAALQQQLDAANAKLGTDDATIAADQAQIDALKATAATAVADFEGGVNSVQVAATALDTHIKTLGQPPATVPPLNPNTTQTP
jgi:hypothetical protein